MREGGSDGTCVPSSSFISALSSAINKVQAFNVHLGSHVRSRYIVCMVKRLFPNVENTIKMVLTHGRV